MSCCITPAMFPAFYRQTLYYDTNQWPYYGSYEQDIVRNIRDMHKKLDAILILLEKRKIKMVDVTIVLDKSGSMGCRKESTINGYNTFLNTQKELGTEGFLTRIQFSTDVYQKSELEPIDKSTKLNSENYMPDGGTPLYDALGRTIKETGDRLRNMKDRPDKVLFVIITDGEENASKEYSKEKIEDMINHQKSKYSWEFIYLGTNQDSYKQASFIGISPTSTMNFSSSMCMYKNIGTLVNRYSVTGDSSFTADERKLQMDADSTYRSS